MVGSQGILRKAGSVHEQGPLLSKTGQAGAGQASATTSTPPPPTIRGTNHPSLPPPMPNVPAHLSPKPLPQRTDSDWERSRRPNWVEPDVYCTSELPRGTDVTCVERLRHVLSSIQSCCLNILEALLVT
jgi:hypothetical protein